MNKALFLDRDGTINVDKHYLISPADFEFEKNVVDALKAAYDKGYLLIVLTNQSGIARGYFTEADLNELHSFIQQKAVENGFEFAEFFYCPHYRDGSVAKYAKDCNCRKPRTEMLDQAVKKFEIDKSLSVMVGDKDADIMLGRAAGVKTVLVGTGYGKKFRNTGINYDYYIDDFSGLNQLLTD